MKVWHIMIKRVGGLIFLLVVAGMVRNAVIAKEVNATSENKFYSAVRRTELAVAYFYKDEARDHKGNRQSKNMLNIVKSLSKSGYYKDADVNFIKVNVGKAKLASLADDFKITQFPTFILFKDGDAVIDDNGSTAVLTGSVTKSQLKSFIDTHLSDDIENIIEAKKEERKRRAEERAASAAYYGYYDPWYGGYGYGYPYRGWGWGGGIGFGWGGGWRGRGWRW